MAVPDTNTFSLQDVVDEVVPTTDDLVDCIADADVDGYDPTYYTAPATSLLEFRNYATPIDPIIETDVTNLEAAWQGFSYSGYCAIDVTPDTMETTITKIDTGDGTSWANVLPAAGTGDYSFRCRVLSDNSTGSVRSMTCRISDDASVAADVDIILTQQFEPI